MIMPTYLTDECVFCDFELFPEHDDDWASWCPDFGLN